MSNSSKLKVTNNDLDAVGLSWRKPRGFLKSQFWDFRNLAVQARHLRTQAQLPRWAADTSNSCTAYCGALIGSWPRISAKSALSRTSWCIHQPAGTSCPQRHVYLHLPEQSCQQPNHPRRAKKLVRKTNLQSLQERLPTHLSATLKLLTPVFTGSLQQGMRHLSRRQQPSGQKATLLYASASLKAPVRIPRHGGHDSTLMADSVPAGWRTPFHGEVGQHSILMADT